MNLINSLNPWQWAVLLAVPPLVVLLYFLKLRRQPLEVPSTFLWRKTIEDLHVNSLWQKLRQNLLLYLQLLFLLGIILACLRPGIPGSTRSGDRYIFLIDHSASMQASDIRPTRLAEAKARVKQEIQALESGDVGMVIAFSDRADVRQGFTEDKQRLLAAVDGVEPTNRTTDIMEALRAASGLANPGRASFDGLNDVKVAEAQPAKLRIFSDGGFVAPTEFDLGNLSALYTPIGKANAENVGIVAFSVQRNEEKEEEVEAYARVLNACSVPVSTMATLTLDGKTVDAATVQIEAGAESGVTFQLNQVPEGNLRLEIDYQDVFPLDNAAYAALRPARQLSLLLVTEGNNALQLALETSQLKRTASLEIQDPSWLKEPEYAQKVATGYYDLILFDRCSPSELPPCNTLFWASQPPGEGWMIGEVQGPLMIVDWDRSHPTMQFLEMGSVRIVEGQTLEPPEGGTSLMQSDLGTILAIAPRGPYQDAVLGFPLVKTTEEGTMINTDWAIKRSFPIFVYAMVEYLGGGITSASAPSVLPGQPIGLSLSNRYERFEVENPKQQTLSVQRGGQSQLTFTQTDDVGIYRVQGVGNEQPLETFAVNLFSQRESGIQVTEEIQMGAEKLDVAKSSIIGRQEFWRWILLIALVVLLLEWVVYNRRVFI